MMARAKLAWLVCFVLAGAVSTSAQQTPGADVFAGYSYLRVNEGSGGTSFDLQRGWGASGTANYDDLFGITANFSGHYETVGGAKTRVHLFTAGPRFSIRRNEVFTPYLHVQAGGAHIRTSAFGGSVINSAYSFAGVVGGGLDVKASERIGIRVGQLDYVLTRFGGSQQHNLRYSAGIVFRFGSR